MVMYAGEVVEYLPVDRLFTDARHPYTLGLIRSIPQLGRRIKSVKRPLPEIPGIVPTLIDLPPGCLFAPRCNSVFDKCYKHRPPLFPIGPEIGGKCWLLEKETCGG
jgi:oligopeptide/dipeptide ABC transporter ATP-binding protein